MQARPAWVLLGGCLLAFLAAAVNADFMLRLGISISHLTGDLSRITIDSVKAGPSREASMLLLSVTGFVGGAATGGFFIHHPSLELGRPYGRSLIAIGGLLLISQAVAPQSALLACFLAAAACGFQNSLATRFRGVILRTTHITGLLTDLGQGIGMKLRGHQIELWKITTPFLLGASFALGATAGAILNVFYHLPVTVLCAGIYIAGGLGWSLWKRR
jgi:uncharacterized membrane protein YoaK (UPF0700 family)